MTRVQIHSSALDADLAPKKVESLSSLISERKRCSPVTSLKLIGALCFLGLVWLVTLARYLDTVAQWMDNEMIPRAGYWVVILATLALWKRWPLLAGPYCRMRIVWMIAGGILILWTWAQPLSPHMCHYIFLLACSSIVFGLGGMVWLKVVLPTLVMLLYLSGLPPAVYSGFVGLLQNFVAFVSYHFGRLFLSSDYIRNGLRIVLPASVDNFGVMVSRGVIVAPECSGFRSLYGLSLMALVFIVDPGLAVLRKVFLFAVAVIIALGVNVVRAIISMSLMHHNLRHLASGLAHSALGQVLMVVEVFILYCIFKALMKRRAGREVTEKCIQNTP